MQRPARNPWAAEMAVDFGRAEREMLPAGLARPAFQSCQGVPKRSKLLRIWSTGSGDRRHDRARARAGGADERELTK
jgi:hypothetical protein